MSGIATGLCRFGLRPGTNAAASAFFSSSISFCVLGTRGGTDRATARRTALIWGGLRFGSVSTASVPPIILANASAVSRSMVAWSRRAMPKSAVCRMVNWGMGGPGAGPALASDGAGGVACLSAAAPISPRSLMSRGMLKSAWAKNRAGDSVLCAKRRVYWL